MSTLDFRPDPFYDRTSELAALERAWTRRAGGGQMLLLYGRRRLGKTYLLQYYFAAGIKGDEAPKPHCYYLAEQTVAVTQRMAMATQLLSVFQADGVDPQEIAVSWNTLLRFVTEQVRRRAHGDGRFALILDEFPYLVEQTPELPSILQGWWDREGIHSSLFVVLCGSQLSAMAALGNENAPLFGRFNAGNFRLEPLSYLDIAAFYQESTLYGAADIMLMYGALGGTPRYHALVDTTQLAATELVTLLMQPRAVLENEVRYLLGTEQIRDPAPYNAVLSAIASGETQFSRIQQRIGAERGTVSFYLRTLQDLAWIRKELPFKETSDRRAIYRVADPFLAFWYRFVAPNASALAFGDPHQIYVERVAPLLGDYMGRYVFEDICMQWLRKQARARLGLNISQMARYWSRDGQTELDIMAELDDGQFLYGECKWRIDSPVRLSDYSHVQARIAGLPEAQWKKDPVIVMFGINGFDHNLTQLAKDPAERLFLVAGEDLLPAGSQSDLK